ncbi:MAG: lipase/acyltransferase domain-containing protein [Gaiellaceae bacterium]
MRGWPRFGIVVIALIGAAVALTGGAGASARASDQAALTPIVLFPAYHFTRLLVTVHDQRVDPACPRSGSFEDFFPNGSPSATFSQVCRDELMTLSYRPHGAWQTRFSDPKGVDVEIEDYGKVSSAPFYGPMYDALQAAGYTLDQNVRVAGYDARLTPDLGGFLERTKRLIEDTYRDNGDRPVHLVGHSNGPLYAQYLLTHTSQAWRDKYIHGFTPIAGNLPGQGSVYSLVFTGLNVGDFSFPSTPDNALSSSLMLLSAPSSYMSMGDPGVFDSRETVVQDLSSGRTYTPSDFRALFTDARLPTALDLAEHYIGFVQFIDPAHFPNVDVYAEKGSGIDTVVGVGLHDLSPGQLLDASTPFFTRDGDVNQEDITNDAVAAWSAMPCWHFSLTDNPGVDHFSLPSDAGVLARLIAAANAPRSNCR